jgi:hypothetical protein
MAVKVGGMDALSGQYPWRWIIIYTNLCVWEREGQELQSWREIHFFQELKQESFNIHKQL